MKQDPLVNWLTTIAVARTEALAVVDKLVATTRGQQTGIDNNQLRQWRVCHGVGGAAAVQRPHGGVVGARGGRGACCSDGRAGSRASVAVNDDGGGRCAIALLGQPRRYWSMRTVASVG